MRIVFVGGGELTVRTARLLIERGHEIIIIERDDSRIEVLREDLDCGYLHGDGSAPHILEEAAPSKCDFLFCVTDNDRDNIIASLVGRSLGFANVVTRIEDNEFEPVCRELELDHVIVPSRTISRYLADMVGGRDIFELSTAIKGEARLFSFTAGKEDAGGVADLDLPERSRAICLYRADKFYLTTDDTRIQQDDEVVLLTHSENLEALRERWRPKQA